MIYKFIYDINGICRGSSRINNKESFSGYCKNSFSISFRNLILRRQSFTINRDVSFTKSKSKTKGWFRSRVLIKDITLEGTISSCGTKELTLLTIKDILE
jgi:hypothetical protein